MWFWSNAINYLHNFLIGLWASNRNKIIKSCFDDLFFFSQATGNDDVAIIFYCLFNRIQRLFNSWVNKTTGIYNNHIRISIGVCKTIAEVLDMPIEKAQDFFESIPAIHRYLKTLCDVGLGLSQNA